MASEMIDEIVRAEKAAEESRAEAHERAAQIIREAQELSSELMAAAGKKAAADGEARIRGAREASAAAVEAAARDAAAQGSKLRAAAKRRRDKAVKAVIERVIPA